MTTLTTPAEGLAAALSLRPALAERAADHDRAGVFPVADFADLRAAGQKALIAYISAGDPNLAATRALASPSDTISICPEIASLAACPPPR